MYFSTNLQKFGQICFNIFFILLFRLNLQPFFSPQAFFCFVRTGYSSHVISDISSSLDLSKTLFTTGHIYSHLELLSKRFSSRPCYKFREGNNDRNGIYSTPIQVISDAILTVYPLRGALAKKKCARVSHEMTQFVLKIALLAIWMQPTPFLEKAQLRSLTPIMAPGINEYSRSFGTSSSCKIVEALAKIILLNHVLSLRQVVRDSLYIYKYCLGIQKDNIYSSMSSQKKSIKGIFLRKG